MAIIQSNWAKGILNVPYPSLAGQVVGQRFVISATAAQLVANNIFELAPIPELCVPVFIALDADDLDTDGTPAVTLDVGIMSSVWGDTDQSRTIGAEFFSGSTVGQAGGLVYPSLKTALRVAPTNTKRSIGVKVATAPDAAQAGDIGLTVLYATQ